MEEKTRKTAIGGDDYEFEWRTPLQNSENKTAERK